MSNKKDSIENRHIVHEAPEKESDEKRSHTSLGFALRLGQYSGSSLRTNSLNRPYIKTPLTRRKDGSGQHEIAGVFDKKQYTYNDTLTAAYMELDKLANESRLEMCFITITLNDTTHRELKAIDAAGKQTMITAVRKWFRAYPYIENAIIVMEECPNSRVETGDLVEPRLHLHIITALNNNNLGMAEQELFKDKRVRGKVDLTWQQCRLYTELDELEEEQFGSAPVGKSDPTDEHWLNRYVKNDQFGNKQVCAELPICLRAADYLSKDLNKPIGRGENFTFIGLNGRKALREDYSGKAKTMLQERA